MAEPQAKPCEASRPDARKVIAELREDLPVIWSAHTTANRERKQLLEMAIESVQLGGIHQAV